MKSKIAIKNVIYSILMQLVSVIVGFIIPKLLLEKFGSSTYGLTVSITRFLGYICFLEAGIGPVIKAALYKPIVNNDKNKILNILKTSDSFFKKIAGIFIIYIIVLCLIYPLFVIEDFDALFTISLILIISISLLFEYFFGMTYKLFLNAKEQNYIVSIIQIVSYILNVLAVFVLVKMNVSIQAVKLVSSLIFIFRPIALKLYVTKKYNYYLKDAKDTNCIKNKWDGLVQHIAAVINESVDVALLTIFGRITDVSIYSIYYMIVSSIKMLLCSICSGIEGTLGNIIAKDNLNNLNKTYKLYEFVFYLISNIAFICTFILIVPFVKVYTSNITDANYINYIFGYIITFAFYIYCLRAPYYSLIMASGHIKQTKRDALIEVLLNLTISIICIIKLGLVGVAIGSLIAMTYRTLAIMYYASKNILERNIFITYKYLLLGLIEFALVYIISKYIPTIEFINYCIWFKYALVIFIISTILVVLINSIFYKQECKDTIKLVKSLLRKKD